MGSAAISEQIAGRAGEGGGQPESLSPISQPHGAVILPHFTASFYISISFLFRIFCFSRKLYLSLHSSSISTVSHTHTVQHYASFYIIIFLTSYQSLSQSQPQALIYASLHHQNTLTMFHRILLPILPLTTTLLRTTGSNLHIIADEDFAFICFLHVMGVMGYYPIRRRNVAVMSSRGVGMAGRLALR